MQTTVTAEKSTNTQGAVLIKQNKRPFFKPINDQAKLIICEVNDTCELEADTIAEKVLSKPVPSTFFKSAPISIKRQEKDKPDNNNSKVLTEGASIIWDNLNDAPDFEEWMGIQTKQLKYKLWDSQPNGLKFGVVGFGLASAGLLGRAIAMDPGFRRKTITTLENVNVTLPLRLLPFNQYLGLSFFKYKLPTASYAPYTFETEFELDDFFNLMRKEWGIPKVELSFGFDSSYKKQNGFKPFTGGTIKLNLGGGIISFQGFYNHQLPPLPMLISDPARNEPPVWMMQFLPGQMEDKMLTGTGVFITVDILRLSELFGTKKELPKTGFNNLIQRKYNGENGSIIDKNTLLFLGNVISSEDGSPIEQRVRSFMEERFEQDFSQVRVHTDKKATESADEINAKAYTIGNDIVFGSGEYNPSTEKGKKLLAHELVHVIQQKGVIRNEECTDKSIVPVEDKELENTIANLISKISNKKSYNDKEVNNEFHTIHLLAPTVEKKMEFYSQNKNLFTTASEKFDPYTGISNATMKELSHPSKVKKDRDIALKRYTILQDLLEENRRAFFDVASFVGTLIEEKDKNTYYKKKYHEQYKALPSEDLVAKMSENLNYEDMESLEFGFDRGINADTDKGTKSSDADRIITQLQDDENFNDPEHLDLLLAIAVRGNLKDRVINEVLNPKMKNGEITEDTILQLEIYGFIATDFTHMESLSIQYLASAIENVGRKATIGFIYQPNTTASVKYKGNWLWYLKKNTKFKRPLLGTYDLRQLQGTKKFKGSLGGMKFSNQTNIQNDFYNDEWLNKIISNDDLLHHNIQDTKISDRQGKVFVSINNDQKVANIYASALQVEGLNYFDAGALYRSGTGIIQGLHVKVNWTNATSDPDNAITKDSPLLSIENFQLKNLLIIDSKSTFAMGYIGMKGLKIELSQSNLPAAKGLKLGLLKNADFVKFVLMDLLPNMLELLTYTAMAVFEELQGPNEPVYKKKLGEVMKNDFSALSAKLSFTALEVKNIYDTTAGFFYDFTVEKKDNTNNPVAQTIEIDEPKYKLIPENFKYGEYNSLTIKAYENITKRINTIDQEQSEAFNTEKEALNKDLDYLKSEYFEDIRLIKGCKNGTERFEACRRVNEFESKYKSIDVVVKLQGIKLEGFYEISELIVDFLSKNGFDTPELNVAEKIEIEALDSIFTASGMGITRTDNNPGINIKNLLIQSIAAKSLSFKTDEINLVSDHPKLTNILVSGEINFEENPLDKNHNGSIIFKISSLLIEKAEFNGLTISIDKSFKLYFPPDTPVEARGIKLWGYDSEIGDINCSIEAVKANGILYIPKDEPNESGPQVDFNIEPKPLNEFQKDSKPAIVIQYNKSVQKLVVGLNIPSVILPNLKWGNISANSIELKDIQAKLNVIWEEETFDQTINDEEDQPFNIYLESLDIAELILNQMEFEDKDLKIVFDKTDPLHMPNLKAGEFEYSSKTGFGKEKGWLKAGSGKVPIDVSLESLKTGSFLAENINGKPAFTLNIASFGFTQDKDGMTISLGRIQGKVPKMTITQAQVTEGDQTVYTITGIDEAIKATSVGIKLYKKNDNGKRKIVIDAVGLEAGGLTVESSETKDKKSTTSNITLHANALGAGSAKLTLNEDRSKEITFKDIYGSNIIFEMASSGPEGKSKINIDLPVPELVTIEAVIISIDKNEKRRITIQKPTIHDFKLKIPAKDKEDDFTSLQCDITIDGDVELGDGKFKDMSLNEPYDAFILNIPEDVPVQIKNMHFEYKASVTTLPGSEEELSPSEKELQKLEKICEENYAYYNKFPAGEGFNFGSKSSDKGLAYFEYLKAEEKYSEEFNKQKPEITAKAEKKANESIYKKILNPNTITNADITPKLIVDIKKFSFQQELPLNVRTWSSKNYIEISKSDLDILKSFFRLFIISTEQAEFWKSNEIKLLSDALKTKSHINALKLIPPIREFMMVMDIDIDAIAEGRGFDALLKILPFVELNIGDLETDKMFSLILKFSFLILKEINLCKSNYVVKHASDSISIDLYGLIEYLGYVSPALSKNTDQQDMRRLQNLVFNLKASKNSAEFLKNKSKSLDELSRMEFEEVGRELLTYLVICFEEHLKTLSSLFANNIKIGVSGNLSLTPQDLITELLKDSGTFTMDKPYSTINNLQVQMDYNPIAKQTSGSLGTGLSGSGDIIIPGGIYLTEDKSTKIKYKELTISPLDLSYKADQLDLSTAKIMLKGFKMAVQKKGK